MALNDLALVDLTQAKAYLRVDAAASLHIDAEYVGTGSAPGEPAVPNPTFTLDNTPIVGSLKVYVDSVLQTEGTHYTYSVATITFVTAHIPEVGEIVTAAYDTVAGENTFESYDDELLERLIEAATKKAEDYTGRAFVQGQLTEKHIGDGTTILQLYRQPAVSITSIDRYHAERVGTGDGETVEFKLDYTPVTGSVVLYVDGVLQVLATDYTISGATITFLIAPTDEARITANYNTEVSDFIEWLNIGRLKRETPWVLGYTYKVIYTAGYGVDRAATQLLIPDAMAAVLLILANLFENRTDLLKSESITGIGSVTYDIPSQAQELLNPLRVDVL